jgi:DNA-binding GntR family transcriptional regulator
MRQMQSKAENRTESAVATLRKDITRGALPPGTLLAEVAVARQLGVSRVPVREALFALEREGLVEFSDTGRAYVKALEPRDFEELFLLRLSLEPLASRLAAPAIRRDPAKLRKNIADTACAENLQDITTLDLDFHQIILEASEHTRLIRICNSLRSELEVWLARMHRDLQARSRETRTMTVDAHTRLLNCFLEKPPAAAERMAREHIQGWREWLPAAPTQPER